MPHGNRPRLHFQVKHSHDYDSPADPRPATDAGKLKGAARGGKERGGKVDMTRKEGPRRTFLIANSARVPMPKLPCTKFEFRKIKLDVLWSFWTVFNFLVTT